jgi:hypothetical protein
VPCCTAKNPRRSEKVLEHGRDPFFDIPRSKAENKTLVMTGDFWFRFQLFLLDTSPDPVPHRGKIRKAFAMDLVYGIQYTRHQGERSPPRRGNNGNSPEKMKYGPKRLSIHTEETSDEYIG